jgi:hypothetical protein
LSTVLNLEGIQQFNILLIETGRIDLMSLSTSLLQPGVLSAAPGVAYA